MTYPDKLLLNYHDSSLYVATARVAKFNEKRD